MLDGSFLLLYYRDDDSIYMRRGRPPSITQRATSDLGWAKTSLMNIQSETGHASSQYGGAFLFVLWMGWVKRGVRPNLEAAAAKHNKLQAILWLKCVMILAEMSASTRWVAGASFRGATRVDKWASLIAIKKTLRARIFRSCLLWCFGGSTDIERCRS